MIPMRSHGSLWHGQSVNLPAEDGTAVVCGRLLCSASLSTRPTYKHKPRSNPLLGLGGSLSPWAPSVPMFASTLLSRNKSENVSHGIGERTLKRFPMSNDGLFPKLSFFPFDSGRAEQASKPPAIQSCRIHCIVSKPHLTVFAGNCCS